MNTQNFEAHYKKYKRRVERALRRLIEVRSPLSVSQPMRYVLSSGGKRVRAVLVLLSCEAVRGNTAAAMPAAIAMEVLHNFTLVHDDVMDNACLRRGRPTVHTKWDANVAILAGDGLVAQAYRSLLQTDSPQLASALRRFTGAFIGVCEGQGLDKEYEDRIRVTPKEYDTMIRKKTGRIIAASTEIGALIGGGSLREVRALQNYGEHIGRAFQIRDDLLDVTGKQKQFGKTIGGDIVEGKKTFLLLSALRRTHGRDRSVLLSVASRNGLSYSDVRRVRKIYEQSGALDAARKEIERCTSHAQHALETLYTSRAKEMLCWLSSQLLGRMS